MITFFMAARSVLAHKKRTFITVVLTAAATALLVFSSAFMSGTHERMLQSAVEIYPGYIQITQKDFRDNPSFDNLIFAEDKIASILSANDDLTTFSPRFESFVLFSAKEKSVGGMLTGIDPDHEQLTSRLASSLREGRYLSERDGNNLYMGSELARRLKVKVGDQLSFIGNGADYSFTADNLIVTGIFKTGLFEFDASASFLNKAYFDEIMASKGIATHFVVLPKKPQESALLARNIQDAIGPEYLAEPWQQTMDGLVEAMEIDSIFGYLTLAIIFLVIFFVIMIYTMLNIHARVREIGVLRAIGTTPGLIFAMLFTESFILSAFSVIIGGLIGGTLCYYFNLHPLELSGYEEQFKQYGLAAGAMPTSFELAAIFRDMAVIFVLSIISTLLPIIRVNRYRPIEAIHHV